MDKPRLIRKNPGIGYRMVNDLLRVDRIMV
jgi:hypothetical protein